jgi:hypothetical protein
MILSLLFLILDLIWVYNFLYFCIFFIFFIYGFYFYGEFIDGL